MLVDFVHHDSDSVSINIIHHSSHISQIIKKCQSSQSNTDQKINQNT